MKMTESSIMTLSGNKKTISFTCWKVIKNLIILSVTFCLVFTSFNGITMLQSTVNDYKGTISQMLIYIAVCISTLLLPEYAIKKFGHKSMLMLSIICFIPYMASNFHVSWFTIIPSSLLLGLVDSLLMNSACTYITELAKVYSAIHVKNYSNRINKISASMQKSIFVVGTINNAFYTKDSVGDGKNVKTNEAINDSGTPKLSVTNNKFISIGKRSLENLSNETRSETWCSKFYYKFNNEHKSFAVEDSSIPNEEKAISAIAAIFFGIFDLFFLSANIWGSLMSYLVTEDNANTINTNMSMKYMNCSCGSNFCNDELNCLKQNLSGFDDFMRNMLTGISISLLAFAALLIFLFLDTLEREKETVNFSFDLAASTLNFLRSTKALLLVPLTVYLGLVKGFFTGDFTKSFIACAWDVSQIGLVFMVFGSTCGIVATISGVLVKLIGRITVMVLAIAVNTGTGIFSLIWNPIPEEPLPLFLTAALWGVVVGIISPQIKAYYGVLFKQEEEVGFVAFFLWSAIGFSISFSYSSYICTYIKIYILLIVSSLGIIGYLITEYMEVRRSNSEEK